MHRRNGRQSETNSEHHGQTEPRPRDRQESEGGQRPANSGGDHHDMSGQSATAPHQNNTHSTRRSHPEPTTGQGRTDVGSAMGGGVTMLRVVSAVFGLFGVLALYVGFELIRVGGSVPTGGSELRVAGLVAFATGAAYLYAAYGVWRLRLSGWRVGMLLVAVGTLGGLYTVLATDAAPVLVGLLVNCALGWALHTNREPFRDRPRRTASAAPVDAADTEQTATGGHQRAGRADGYASERRGGH